MDPWLLEDCYGLPYHDNYDVGERIGAVLTDVSGIDDAHFLYSKDQVSLSQLGKEINEWYSNYDFEDEVRKAFAVSVSEKSYCVVKEGDGSFYRCYVISIARSDYTVLYVDYGKTVTCKEHTIYPIHHKFQQQPIFAVKCIFKRSSTEAFSQSGNAAFILKMEKYRSGKAYSWNIERLERGEPNEFEISFTSQSRMKYFNELVEQINLDYPLSNDADIETSSDIEDEISHRVDVESILEPTISTPSSGHTSVELLDDPSTHGGGPNIESYTCSAIDEALGFISPETQNSVLNDDDEHIESDISSTEEAHEKRQKKRKQLNKMEREKRQQMKRLDAKKKRDKEYRSDYNRRGPTQPTGWDNPGASTGQRSPPVYSNNNGYSNGNRFQNNDYGYAHGNARILYSKEPWSNGGKDLKKVDNDSNWKRSPGQSNTCSAVSGSSHSDSNNVVVGNGVVVDTGIEYGQNPTWSTVPGASFAPPPPLPPPQVQPLLSNRHGKPKEGYWNDNSITANVPPQSYGANQCNSGAGVVPSSGSVPFTGSPSKTFVLERGPQASVANVPGKGDDSSDGFRSARCTITNAPDFTVNDRIKLLDKIDGYRHSSQQSQAPAVGYSGNVSRELGSQVDDFVHVTPPASAKSFEIKFPSLPSIPTSPGRSDEVLPGWNLPVAIDCANLGPGRSSGMSTPMHSAVSSGQRTAVAMMPRLSPSLTFEHLFLAWPAIKRPVPNLTYYVRRSSADGLQYVNLKTIEHDEMSMKMAEHLADYGLLVQLQAKCSVLDFTDQIRGMIANKQHVACLARTTNNKWCRAVLWSLNSNCIDKNHLCNVKFVDSGEKTILPADDVCLIRRPHDINTYPFNIAPLCWPSSLVANSDRIEVSLQVKMACAFDEICNGNSNDTGCFFNAIFPTQQPSDDYLFCELRDLKRSENVVDNVRKAITSKFGPLFGELL